ncbi:hypothetical protein SCLCIDRAFT_820463 [Scleroderma citrinum Foug A]|uniref:Uncharacterized protein n=1 Tax=Scleroderma citrinum Foug A TaxID=1036808 RepID=A0A0C3ELR5_9AGAM|nr:hypothetical protein SCLCIDRAFT_820463 [Scleroderma citrinum Foug A]
MDVQNNASQTVTSSRSDHGVHSHSQVLKPCEQPLTNLELIELWSRALIQRELARKRLDYAQEALDDYAFEITHIIGQTEYDPFLEMYLGAIQRARTATTLKVCVPTATE